MSSALLVLRRYWGIVGLVVVNVYLIARGLWWGVLLATAGVLVYVVAVGSVLAYQRFANRNAKRP